MPLLNFTQYLRPDGKPRPVQIDLPQGPWETGMKIIEAGAHFDVEELSTGVVSLTCELNVPVVTITEDGEEEETEMLSIELTENGPGMTDVVVLLIENAAKMLGCVGRPLPEGPYLGKPPKSLLEGLSDNTLEDLNNYLKDYEN